MIAGARFAVAVPDVHVIATGRPLRFAAPSAKKPAQRSSMCEKQRSRGSRTSARTSGDEREPGEVQASRMPQRASSSANARSRRWVSGRAGMMAGCPSRSSSCMASRRPVAAGTRWCATSTANAIARWLPTSGATGRPRRAGRSTSTPACRTPSASCVRRSRWPAIRREVASRCTSRSRIPSSSPGSCSCPPPQASRTPRSARGAVTPTRRSPHGWRPTAGPCTRSPTAGARRPCSRHSRPRSRRPPGPTVSPTSRCTSRPRCAGSAPGSWSRSGDASGSSRCRWSCSPASTTRGTSRWGTDGGGAARATLEIVPAAGHALPLEAPAAVARTIGSRGGH